MITLCKDVAVDIVVAFAVFLVVGVAAHKAPEKGICGSHPISQTAPQASAK